MKLLLLNGANLNYLGKRDPKHYGTYTLADVEKAVTDYAAKFGVQVACAQSNCEGTLIDLLQGADCDAAILNAGAYSHYSYALRDCVECLNYPVVEVHVSDVYNREDFRKVDVIKEVAAGYCYGKGMQSYLDAVDCAIGIVKKQYTPYRNA